MAHIFSLLVLSSQITYICLTTFGYGSSPWRILLWMFISETLQVRTGTFI